jgi:hypothetical protein
MVLPEALARVMGHGEHSLSPGNVMGRNRCVMGGMKSLQAAQAHVGRPFEGLAWVVGSFITHGNAQK